MQRRDFVSGAIGAVVGGVATWFASRRSDRGGDIIGAPAVATGNRELKMVTTWPRDFPGLGTGAQRIADRITSASDGRLKVTLYAAGELVAPLESFDQVSAGTADLMHGASYYWQGKSKGFNFFAAVPFGLTAGELNAWIRYGGGQELWEELCKPFNLMPMLGGNSGVQMGGWFRKEVKSPEDFVGLKMRMPGLGGAVISKMGGAAVTLPGGEIFQALQSGTIDATEWVGPYNDLALGFYKVAKYYYYPGFHEPGTALECTWNLDVWNSLSDAEKTIVRDATAAENDTMLAEFNHFNAGSLGTLLNTHGVQLRRFSNDTYKAFADNTKEVLEETAKENELTGRIYKSFVEARERSIGWTLISEQAYAEQRRLSLGYS